MFVKNRKSGEVRTLVHSEHGYLAVNTFHIDVGGSDPLLNKEIAQTILPLPGVRVSRGLQ
jgi:hypothetical protein